MRRIYRLRTWRARLRKDRFTHWLRRYRASGVIIRVGVDIPWARRGSRLHRRFLNAPALLNTPALLNKGALRNERSVRIHSPR
jgi:hypothetical protein